MWFVFQTSIVLGMTWVTIKLVDIGFYPKDDGFLVAILPVAAAFFATHFLSETIADIRAWRQRRRETKARMARARKMDSGYEILAPLPPQNKTRRSAPRLIEHESFHRGF